MCFSWMGTQGSLPPSLSACVCVLVCVCVCVKSSYAAEERGGGVTTTNSTHQ